MYCIIVLNYEGKEISQTTLQVNVLLIIKGIIAMKNPRLDTSEIRRRENITNNLAKKICSKQNRLLQYTLYCNTIQNIRDYNYTAGWTNKILLELGIVTIKVVC